MSETQDRSHKQAQVQELARHGLSDQSIAQKLGLRPATVRNYRTKTLVAAGSPVTAREQQVSDLARQGLTNAAIGQQLGISTRTAEIYRQSALKKLGAGNAAHLASMHLDREKNFLQMRVAELEAKVAELEEHIAKFEGKA